MKVLVTGADGYIGICLTQVLLERGFYVIGLDTGFYRSGWLYNGIKKLPEIISKDVRDVTAADLKGFDAIVHLAELSNDPVGELDSKITYKINHLGTKHLVKMAKKAGISRFIYFSSCSVYGASDETLDETSKLNPLTAYAKCKVLNEKLLLKEANRKFCSTIFRNATVFGFSPRMRFDLAINNLSGVAFTSREIKMQSDGTSWRPFVHVLDVCQAVVCVLKTPKNKIYRQIFNVGDNNLNFQIKDISKQIKKYLPRAKITLNKDNKDMRSYRISFDKIRRVIPQFKCQMSLEDGLKELIAIYKKVDMEKETFESKNYTRLKQIKHLRSTRQINKEFYWT